jgi:hypothetical protein
MNQLDYSFDYFKKTSKVKESSTVEKKEQYNPYVNNSGTVMGIFIIY